jgi:hypothetical protein
MDVEKEIRGINFDINQLFERGDVLDRDFHTLERQMNLLPNQVFQAIQAWIAEQSFAQPAITGPLPLMGPVEARIEVPDDEPPPPPPPKLKHKPPKVERVIEKFVPLDVQIDAFQVSKARIMIASDLEELKDRIVEIYEFCKRTRFELRATATEIGVMTGCYQPAVMLDYTITNFIMPTESYSAEFVEYFAHLGEINPADWLVAVRLLHECIIEHDDPILQTLKPCWVFARNRGVFDNMIERMREVITRYQDKKNIDGAVDLYLKRHTGAVITNLWDHTGWRFALSTNTFEVGGVDHWQPCTLAELFIDC